MEHFKTMAMIKVEIKVKLLTSFSILWLVLVSDKFINSHNSNIFFGKNAFSK